VPLGSACNRVSSLTFAHVTRFDGVALVGQGKADHLEYLGVRAASGGSRASSRAALPSKRGLAPATGSPPPPFAAVAACHRFEFFPS